MESPLDELSKGWFFGIFRPVIYLRGIGESGKRVDEEKGERLQQWWWMMVPGTSQETRRTEKNEIKEREKRGEYSGSKRNDRNFTCRGCARFQSLSLFRAFSSLRFISRTLYGCEIRVFFCPSLHIGVSPQLRSRFSREHHTLLSARVSHPPKLFSIITPRSHLFAGMPTTPRFFFSSVRRSHAHGCNGGA